MLDAYYSVGCNTEELFQKFQISKQSSFGEHLNQYNVIHLDIASVADFHKEDLVEEIVDRLSAEFSEAYPGQLDTGKDLNLMIN